MEASGPHELEPERVKELLDGGEAQIVDVRTEEEHAAGHIADTPLIPFDALTARASEIDQGRPVVFYCKVGARSGVATDAFRASGYEAFNMAGGLVEWDRRGLPLAPEGGRVAGAD